ncbi:MAG: hypothetical protein ACRCYS_02880, partial [Beijerinckiaceae bacterium]
MLLYLLLNQIALQAQRLRRMARKSIKSLLASKSCLPQSQETYRLKFPIIYVTKQMENATDTPDRPAQESDRAVMAAVVALIAKWEVSGDLASDLAYE